MRHDVVAILQGRPRASLASRRSARDHAARRRRGPLRARLTAVVVSVVASVSVTVGCAAIPMAGPVGSGDPAAPDPGSVFPLAEGPREGASPQQIVLDFIRAGAAGFGDEFAVAREFLTEAAQATWEPLEQVLVYSSTPASPGVLVREVGRVQVSLEVAATVDAAGRYVRAGDERLTDEQFRLIEEAGEWRISQLPDAVMLNEPNFQTLFRQVPLYFPTVDGRYLVPDIRWFPQRNTATSAVRALFEGPSDWLREGVATPVAQGLELSLGVVTVAEGIATVDLSPEATAATPQERSLLQAQLEAVLLRLPAIREVQLAVAGAPLDSVAASLIRDPQPDAEPIMIAGDALAQLDKGVVAPLPDVVLDGLDASSPTVGPDGVVVVLDGGSRLVRVGPDAAAHVELLSGQRLVAPVGDRFGWVWTGEVDSAGVLDAVSAVGTRVPVAASWLTGRVVHSLQVSRDGARVLVVSATPAGLAVEVAAVVRDPQGVPLRVGAPLTLGVLTGTTADADWMDESTVAVLTTSDQTAELRSYRIGGRQHETIAVVDGAVSLTAGRGDWSLYVVTTDGTLYARSLSGWTVLTAGVRDPSFPGFSG